jgi:hypothetical protein
MSILQTLVASGRGKLRGEYRQVIGAGKLESSRWGRLAELSAEGCVGLISDEFGE